MSNIIRLGEDIMDAKLGIEREALPDGLKVMMNKVAGSNRAGSERMEKLLSYHLQRH